MLSDNEIVGEFQENYRYCHDFWAPFVKNAQVYTLAASGYTWSDNEIKELSKEGREPLELNIMRRPLQFYSGYLRDNLNSIVVEPLEGSDQQTADQFTSLQYYVWDKGGGYNTFLDSADEGMKSGISLCGIYMDYNKDFVNGDIAFYKRTYNSFYLDPTFEKISLEDCGFAIMRDLLNRNMIKGLLPFVDPAIIDDIQGSFRDDKFLSYHPNFTTLSRNRNLMAYDQYYKRISKMREFLVDESSGFYRDITDLEEDEKRRLKIGIKRIKDLHREANAIGASTKDLPPMVDIRSVERNFIELNIMLNGQRVYCGPDKTGIEKTYPFVPILGYMEPSIWMPSQRLQGIAATLWSAQRQFNKRHMKIVDMMDSTISTGFKYLIGSIPDPSDMQQSGQNRMIGVSGDSTVNPDGLNAVQELNGGTASPALFEYQNILDKLTLTLANVNESVLGIDDKGNTQLSGRLAQVRIAQGLRSNRKIFDNIEVSQTLLGGIVLECIQNKYTPDKVRRILGEDPTQQFYEKDFEQYDAVLREGVRSKSQRDAYYYEIINLKREGLVDVPQAEILENLPMAGQSKLQKSIEKQEMQKQQQTQQLAQLEMSKIAADIDEKKALARERNTRGDANEGLEIERASEAVQNTAQAALDRAKTITEISQMETDQLMRVVQFVNELEADATLQRESMIQRAEGLSEQERSQPVQPQQEMVEEQVDVNDQLNL